MRRFRGLKYFLAPSWLTGRGDGERIAHVVEMFLDAFTERAKLGLEARLPSRADSSALEFIRGDRGMLRNRAATPDVDNLLAWRTPRSHRVRGNAYEALIQIWRYWSGIYAAIVDSHGRRHVIQAADDPSDVDSLADPDMLATWVDGSNTAWDGVDADTNWSRFWVVLHPTAGVTAQLSLGDPDLWGGSLTTIRPEDTLGQQGITPEDVAAMRRLFQELKWHGGHTVPEWLVLILSDAPEGTRNIAPDGNWKHWSKDDGAGNRVPARVFAPLTVEHGDFATREGAGDLTVSPPLGTDVGDLMLLHEARSAGTFDSPPTGWTLVSSRVGFFMGSRVYARVADGPEGSFVWALTGSGNHVARITKISPPVGGWSETVLDNFSEIATASGNGVGSTVPDPTNAAGQHRLNFIAYDFFDVPFSISSTGYTELYESQGNMNLSLSQATGSVSGSVSSFSESDKSWTQISLVLNYDQAPYRFWSLDPARNNTYPGYRNRPWSDTTTLVDGSVYGGVRTNGAAFGVIELPTGDDGAGGGVYSGSRGNFPVGVLLLDDGSVPK